MQDIKEVMRSYPNWKLNFLDGNDIFYSQYAEAGDPDYKQFYERVREDRGNLGSEKFSFLGLSTLASVCRGAFYTLNSNVCVLGHQ